jgi:hypothetical protein
MMVNDDDDEGNGTVRLGKKRSFPPVENIN